jgi:hypothetical protein
LGGGTLLRKVYPAYFRWCACRGIEGCSRFHLGERRAVGMVG